MTCCAPFPACNGQQRDGRQTTHDAIAPSRSYIDAAPGPFAGTWGFLLCGRKDWGLAD